MKLALSLALVAVAAASQAVSFTVLSAKTNGVGGVQTFTPNISGNTLTSTVNRTATAIPATINLDFKASAAPAALSSVTYNLFFLKSASASGVVKGTFTYNPVGVAQGGGDADLAGGVQDLTGTANYVSIASLSSIVNIGGVDYYKLTKTLNVASYATPKWHFVLDDAWKNATLSNVTQTVTPVPEPATMAALGLGALGLLKRRRKA